MRQICYILALLFVLNACAKEGVSDVENGDKGSITIGRVTNIISKAGLNRLELSWREPANLGDIKLSKYRVFWNGGKDSLEVSANTAADSVLLMINDLKEDSYIFSIIAYDNQGNKSSGASGYGRTYGSEYQSALVNRPVKSAFFDKTKGAVEISWNPTTTGAIVSEVKYIDNSGVQHLLEIPINEEKTRLDNFKEGSEVLYRTSFLPQSSAIDIFYTDYEPVTITLMPDNLGAHLTEGWKDTPYTFSIQTAHDLPKSDRYQFKDNIHHFWIYPSDSPHTPTSETGPRSELRMQNDYLLGRHQFEGDVYILPGSTGTDVMQVFGGVTHSTSFMMKIHAANNGTLRRYDNEILMTNVYERWIHVNVQHDADKGKVYVYLDGKSVGVFDDRGEKTHYFKCGTYNITGSRSESRWKNVKYWKDGPIGGK